ncbi:MAG: hypothetical protein ACW99J_01625 [Candidatus Thorarchaeota archaeon]|jgi:hypothetical protein
MLLEVSGLRRRNLVIAMLFLSFLAAPPFVDPLAPLVVDSQVSASIDKVTDNSLRDEYSPNQKESDPTKELDSVVPNPSVSYALSEETPWNGQLNPLELVTSGLNTITTGTQEARTDVIPSASNNMSLGIADGWKSDQVDIDLWDLKLLYALNGTFDDGLNGTNVDWTGDGTYGPFGWNADRFRQNAEEHQRSSFVNSSRKYVVIENEGQLKDLQDGEYKHFHNTYVSWHQDFALDPYTELFTFSFDYQYFRGPLGTKWDNRFYLQARLNGTTFWEIDPALMTQRGTWYSSGDVSVDLTDYSLDGSTGLHFELGFFINSDFNPKETEPETRDVNDSKYVTFYLDDVSFNSATPPTPEEVEMEVTLPGVVSTAVLGSSGTGGLVVNNSALWNVNNAVLEISANDTISFSYEAQFLSIFHFDNSSWRSAPQSEGITFSTRKGQSVNLSFYFYVDSHDSIDSFQVNTSFPFDWENVTVFDSFMDNVTEHCTITPGSILISGSALDRVGWWEAELQSPNYAKSIITQKFSSGDWIAEDVFWPGNQTRTAISLGTSSSTPPQSDDVSITWLMPNGTEWHAESASGGSNGLVNGSSVVVGPNNSTVGVWSVVIEWDNGTEVAYDAAMFAIHHRANLTAVYTLIETETGMIVSGSVQYSDLDTGVSMLDGYATIASNWSSGQVSFEPNLAKEWWEAALDTSLVGFGNHIVIVNASKQFYGNATCAFSVSVITKTRLTSPNLPWTLAIWNTTATLVLNYEGYDHNTETWSPITNASTDVYIWTNWTVGGWSVVEQPTPGVYHLLVDTSVLPAATRILNITCSRPDHEFQQVELSLIVEPSGSTLSVMGDASVGEYANESLVVKLRFINSESQPLVGANITVDYVSPASGIDFVNISEVVGEPGNYSIDIDTVVPDVYTIRFLAAKQSISNATAVFVLEVGAIPTSLTIMGDDSVEIQNDEDYEVILRFTNFKGAALTGANVTVQNISPSSGLNESSTTEVPGEPGNYSITLTPSVPGVYTVQFEAYRLYHLNSTTILVLDVSGIPTELVHLGESFVEIGLTGSYDALMRYQNPDTSGIDNATVEVLFWSGPSNGLNWSLTTEISGEMGNYSITFNATKTGTYSITLRGLKENHQSASTSFFLVVNDIQTQFVCLNGTNDVVSMSGTYPLAVYYANGTGFGLPGATVEVVSITPGLGMNATETQYLTNGTYVIELIPVLTGSYALVLRASLLNYQTQFATFTLTATPIASFLTISPSSASVAIDQNYTVSLSFLNVSFGGLESADISVLSVTPAIGVTYSGTTEIGGGNYSITLTPSETGVFDFVFRATLENHQNGTAAFTLIVTEIPTLLHTQGGVSSASIQFLESFDLLLMLERTDIQVNVTGVSFDIRASPSDGLNYTLQDETDHYRMVLTTNRTGSWLLTITASKQYHVNSTIQFILEVTILDTTLTGTGPPEFLFFGSTLSFLIGYNVTNGPGIDSSTVSFSGITSEELSWANMGGGWYNVTLSPGGLGNFTDVLLRFEKSGHEEQVLTFSFEVRRIETELIVDPIASTIYFGRQFEFGVLFNSSVDDGTDNATIVFSGIAEDEISWIVSGTGLYNFTVAPSGLGSYSNVSIRFSKEGYESKTLTFSFIVDRIPMNLGSNSSISSSYDLIEGTDIGIVLELLVADLATLVEGATITLELVDLTSNNTIYITTLDEIAPGLYSANVSVPTNNAAGYTIRITIQKLNHETFYYEASLNARLRILDIGSNSALLGFYDQTEGSMLTLILELVDADTALLIEGAVVEYVVSNQMGVVLSGLFSEESPGLYRATFEIPLASEIHYNLSVTVEKAHCEQLRFEAELVSRLLIMEFGPNSTLSPTYSSVEGDSVLVVVELLVPEISGVVANATVSLELVDLDNNQTVQNYVLTPISLGTYTVTITVPRHNELGYDIRVRAEKVHFGTLEYEAHLISRILFMDLAPGTVVSLTDIDTDSVLSLVDPQEVIEHRTYMLTIVLVDTETQQGIEDANVTVGLFYSNGTLHSSLPVEFGPEGLYRATIEAPDRGSFFLNITVSRDHYEDFVFTQILFSAPDVELQNELLLQQVLLAAGGVVGVLLLLAGAVVGRSAYGRRRASRALETIALKSRFDDARNIIGCLILMKQAGLPVYSRAIRGDFEEAILGGFISAITSFRSELKDDELLWSSIPISDVVTAVQTESLTCALMTFTAPSDEQKSKLEALAEGIGLLYDEQLRRPTGLVADPEIVRHIDQLFTGYLDIGLLLHYVGFKDPPTSSDLIKVRDAIEESDDGTGSTPEEMTKLMMSRGISEGKALRLVFQAIDDGLLTPTEGSLGMAPVGASGLTPDEEFELTP